MDDNGNVREDLKLPTPDDAEQLAGQIQASWDEGKELVLTVLKSMNQEQVNARRGAQERGLGALEKLSRAFRGGDVARPQRGGLSLPEGAFLTRETRGDHTNCSEFSCSEI